MASPTVKITEGLLRQVNRYAKALLDALPHYQAELEKQKQGDIDPDREHESKKIDN